MDALFLEEFIILISYVKDDYKEILHESVKETYLAHRNETTLTDH